ncbi:NADPH oxidase 4 [Eumeta japonica]|uniref:NADPH oxidase 4 n=1 Tax=Eumeta variegata TaxID=151549 RepID=A0A4C1YMR3_EUMVA|nr:NADPH oxidase 4 [Eumeta japonica]
MLMTERGRRKSKPRQHEARIVRTKGSGEEGGDTMSRGCDSTEAENEDANSSGSDPEWTPPPHYRARLPSSPSKNPLRMILTQPGLTGVSMLLIILSMGVTSLRPVRRKFYNAFWYTHRLYLPFLLLLLVHPLSGVLKERVIESHDALTNITDLGGNDGEIQFVSIKSMTWYWMAFPLSCFFVDTVWRLCSRNRNRVRILEVNFVNLLSGSFFIGSIRGKRVCGQSKSRWSSPPIDTRNARGVTCALSGF